MEDKIKILYVRKYHWTHPEFMEHFADKPMFEVTGTVDSVARALETIRQKPPDVIITDVLFKKGSVLDLIKGIDADETLPGRPHMVIFTLPSCEAMYYTHLADHVISDCYPHGLTRVENYLLRVRDEQRPTD